MRRRDVSALIAGTAAGCLAIRVRAQPSKTFQLDILESGSHWTRCWREGFEPSVALATASLILAEEKGLQADPARAGTAA
jgi:hypothetical protein